jgi:hypothetical protein
MNNPTIESIVHERGTVGEEVLLEVVYAIDRQNAELERIGDLLRKQQVSQSASMREVVAALRFIGNHI